MTAGDLSRSWGEGQTSGDAEETARQARFRALAEVTNALIWVLSAEGVVAEAQPSLQSFTGLSFEQIQGAGWVQALHPADCERVLAEWQGYLRAKTPAEIHYRMRRHDGVYRWMRARAIPIFNADGSIREWAGANEDVTEERQKHEALREREERLQQFADSLPHIAWQTTPDGAATWFNQQFYHYTGLSSEVALGWNWDQAVHPADRHDYVEGWKWATREGSVYTAELRLRRHDGAMRWFKLSTAPQMGKNGRVYRWYGTGTDIHEIRLNADRIQKFIATLGHELRNPLAPVRSGLRILQSRTNDPNSAELIAMIDRQVDHMVRLIEDLLDINRVTTGGLLLKREVLVLAKVLAGAIEISRPLIDQKKHPLELVLPEEDCFIDADPTRLAQVFGNLLNNAAKYSAEGTPIRVIVRRADDAVSVDVEDEGIGIPAEMVNRVFDIFTRVEQEGEPAQEGLGIGLSVAKRLTEMHGGSIEVHSVGRGRGSRFRVTLPLAAMRSGTERSGLSDPGEGPPRKVLIVDDNTDAATSMATLVGMMGHDARAVHSGLDALALGASLQPDIIFLDIGMPDRDGYSVARELRGTPWGKAVQLIALTGWGQPDDLAKSRDAGFDAHIVKPIDSRMLSRILEGHL